MFLGNTVLALNYIFSRSYCYKVFFNLYFLRLLKEYKKKCLEVDINFFVKSLNLTICLIWKLVTSKTATLQTSKKQQMFD